MSTGASAEAARLLVDDLDELKKMRQALKRKEDAYYDFIFQRRKGRSSDEWGDEGELEGLDALNTEKQLFRNALLHKEMAVGEKLHNFSKSFARTFNTHPEDVYRMLVTLSKQKMTEL